MNIGKDVIIVSTPESLPDDAIEDAWSTPYAHGYYFAALLTPRDGNIRAVFKRSASYSDPTEDAAALEIARAHPELAEQGAASVYGMIAHAPFRDMVRSQVLDTFANYYVPQDDPSGKAGPF